jgi:hypothetical protein
MPNRRLPAIARRTSRRYRGSKILSAMDWPARGGDGAAHGLGVAASWEQADASCACRAMQSGGQAHLQGGAQAHLRHTLRLPAAQRLTRQQQGHDEQRQRRLIRGGAQRQTLLLPTRGVIGCGAAAGPRHASPGCLWISPRSGGARRDQHGPSAGPAQRRMNRRRSPG